MSYVRPRAVGAVDWDRAGVTWSLMSAKTWPAVAAAAVLAWFVVKKPAKKRRR